MEPGQLLVEALGRCLSRNAILLLLFVVVGLVSLGLLVICLVNVDIFEKKLTFKSNFLLKFSRSNHRGARWPFRRWRPRDRWRCRRRFLAQAMTTTWTVAAAVFVVD